MLAYIALLSLDQERLWRETVSDYVAEEEVPEGELTATEINPNMYHDIQVILSRLVVKAEQLIDNVTTNLAESWMHVRTKFDGGKVINRSQSGSWEHRCMGAGLQHNMGKEWGPVAWKQMTNTSPTKIFKNTSQRSAIKASSEKERKAKESVKKRRRMKKVTQKKESSKGRRAYTRHDDGVSPGDCHDDVSPEHLEALKMSFFKTKVQVTSGKISHIQEQTRGQTDSDMWIAERRKRLTASIVGGIIKMRSTTKRATKVENL